MPSSSRADVHIFTDGSIDKNRRGIESLGSAAIIAVTLDRTGESGYADIQSMVIHSSLGRGLHITNNWAEIYGLRLASIEAQGYRNASIWSDSKYALGAVCKTSWNLKHADHRTLVKHIRDEARDAGKVIYDGSQVTTPSIAPENQEDITGRWTFLHTKGEKHKRDHTSWWSFFNALADLVAKHSIHVRSGITLRFSEGSGQLMFTMMEKAILGKLSRS